MAIKNYSIKKGNSSPDNKMLNLGELLSDLINKNTVDNAKEQNSEIKDHNPYKWVDIIEFCESPYYLKLNLYPWQKLILKLFYMGSDGNRHLSIVDKESGCRNCIWNKSFSNLRGFSPCLKCHDYPSEEFDKNIEEARDKWWISPDEADLLVNTEKTKMFCNEKQLIEVDLMDESDTTEGGSVKRQVKNKIGKQFSEMLLVLGRRSGKMLSLDTPIITPDGWKTMGDLHPKDFVFGPDGFATRIIAESPVDYNAECYEVEFSNGEKIKCHSEHEWKTLTIEQTRSENPEYQIFTTKEISETLYFENKYNHCLETTSHLKYEEKNCKIHPYLLGYWVALDSMGENDKSEILDENNIFKYIDDNCKYKSSYKEPDIDIMNLFSFHLTLPAFCRAELLRGIMDVKGKVHPVNKSVSFYSQSAEIVEKVYELVCGLGFKAKMQQKKDQNGNDIFIVIFLPNNNIRVFNIESKILEQCNFDNRKIFITKVTKIDSIPMKCIQVDNLSHEYLCGKSMIPTHNSMIVSIIALYESYKLLEMGNPQAIFGNLNEGDTITILNVAVSEQQAKESVFDKIKPMITNSAYFKTKISPNSLQNRSVRFITPRDREINEQLINEGLPAREGSIYLLSGHSNSDSLVGKNVLVVIIDEMASMVGKDGSKMSDEELYTKLKHSIWTFGRSAKIICISNPLTKDGKFFELYEQSFKDDRILMVQLPSYKVNPTLDQKALNEEKEAAQKAGQYEQYLTQIEARFSGGAADPFIPAEFIDEAFEKGSNRRRAEVGDPHILYYLHLDPANNSDNYALALVHVENDPYNLDQNGKARKIIIVDHINMWSPSATGDPVIINDVDQYVIDLTRRFNIVSITYDMWESAASTQLLQRMGLPARITHFNSAYKQQIYSTLRNLFYQRNIEFYKLDGFDGTRMIDTYGFVNETADQFKFLTRRLNRDSFSVFAASGHYDDIPDCVAGASFIALTGQHGHVSLPRMSTVRMAAFK